MALTKIIEIDRSEPKEEYLKLAANTVAKGGLVIIPTETVYGIACNLLNKKAVERLYAIKQRPKDKPFSLHIAQKEKVEDFAVNIPIAAWKLIDRFWPGPLTLIMEAKSGSTVGIRMPDDAVAREIITRARVPVACPSANISGNPAPVDFGEAIDSLNGLVDLGIDAGRTKLGIESTIVDVSQGTLQIVREGALKKQDIEAVAQKKTILFICTGNSCRSVMAKALFEKKLRERGRQDIEVSSAGIMMLSGMGATKATQEVLAKEDIDVSGHRSQKVSSSMINKSDLILVMERLHEDKILELAPQAKNRVFLLKEFAKMNDTNLDIDDPIGKSNDFYEQTLNTIKEAVETISFLI